MPMLTDSDSYEKVN